MPFVPLDVDGTERTCRTKILACTAPDTAFRVDYGDFKRIGRIRFGSHHLDSARRAMSGAVSTLYPIRQRNTILLYPNGMPYLDSRLVCRSNRRNRTGGTNLGAFGTFRPAIPTLVGHLRLHQFHQTGSRAKYLVRTYRYTQLASGAMLCKMTGTQ